MSVEDASEPLFDAVKRRHRVLVSIGIAAVLAGGVIAGFVGWEWFVNRISHEILAIVAAVGLLFGVQLLVFATLTDMLIVLHTEQLRRLEAANPATDDDS